MSPRIVLYGTWLALVGCGGSINTTSQELKPDAATRDAAGPDVELVEASPHDAAPGDADGGIVAVVDAAEADAPLPFCFPTVYGPIECCGSNGCDPDSGRPLCACPSCVSVSGGITCGASPEEAGACGALDAPCANVPDGGTVYTCCSGLVCDTLVNTIPGIPITCQPPVCLGRTCSTDSDCCFGAVCGSGGTCVFGG